MENGTLHHCIFTRIPQRLPYGHIAEKLPVIVKANKYITFAESPCFEKALIYGLENGDDV